MSSDRNEDIKNSTNEYQEADNDPRVLETKHVFPEDYKCQPCLKKEKESIKPPKLEETISRPIPTNKLNETLKKQKCTHCTKEATGECQCLSDEARKELTKIHEYKQEENKQEAGETMKK